MASLRGLNPYAPEFFLSKTPRSSSCYQLEHPPIYPLYYYYSVGPTGFLNPNQTELLGHHQVQQQITHEFEAAPKFDLPKPPRNMRAGKSRYCNSSFYYKPSETGTKPWSEKKAAPLSKKKPVDCYRRGMKKKKHNSDVLPVMEHGVATTVMIRNIPNKYTRDLLVAFLNRHCAQENLKSSNGEEDSAFDFVYLPIDFWTGMNKGYAFVNFTNPKAVWKFYLAAHSQTWDDSFNSKKIREIAHARIQGKEDLMDHFETMVFPCKSEKVLPVCFSPARDGSEKAVETRLVGKLKGWDLIGSSLGKVKEAQLATT